MLNMHPPVVDLIKEFDICALVQGDRIGVAENLNAYIALNLTFNTAEAVHRHTYIIPHT